MHCRQGPRNEKAASPQFGVRDFGIVRLRQSLWRSTSSRPRSALEDRQPRADRCGYGVLDENLNGASNATQKKVNFLAGEHVNYVPAPSRVTTAT